MAVDLPMNNNIFLKKIHFNSKRSSQMSTLVPSASRMFFAGLGKKKRNSHFYTSVHLNTTPLICIPVKLSIYIKKNPDALCTVYFL